MRIDPGNSNYEAHGDTLRRTVTCVNLFQCSFWVGLVVRICRASNHTEVPCCKLGGGTGPWLAACFCGTWLYIIATWRCSCDCWMLPGYLSHVINTTFIQTKYSCLNTNSIPRLSQDSTSYLFSHSKSSPLLLVGPGSLVRVFFVR